MKRTAHTAVALLVLTLLASARAAEPVAPPEFTHPQAADWVNSPPLTLAGLRGKVVLVEFWAFECSNCLASRAWLDSVASTRARAGLVVIGVHTPELPDERSAANVRQAVTRLNIRHPVMIDGDYSYWNAMHNQYWPAFYLIGRDGRLHGHAVGEMHVGEDGARQVEARIDELLAAPAR
jgi:thiol-disulfide isomerase/thioredoxin